MANNNACNKIFDTNRKKDLILTERLGRLLLSQSFDFLTLCIPVRCNGGNFIAFLYTIPPLFFRMLARCVWPLRRAHDSGVLPF